MYTNEELEEMAEKLLKNKQLGDLIYILNNKESNLILRLVQYLENIKNSQISDEENKVTDLAYSYAWAVDNLGEKEVLKKFDGFGNNYRKGLLVLANFFSGAAVEETYLELVSKIENQEG